MLAILITVYNESGKSVGSTKQGFLLIGGKLTFDSYGIFS